VPIQRASQARRKLNVSPVCRWSSAAWRGRPCLGCRTLAVVEGGVGDSIDYCQRRRSSDIGHHPLIRQLVNRTPPITSAVQVRSVALRVTQSFQP
jgi:hypothetical protein